ncbi:MAG TPA: hypothetical protein VHR45_22335 [Thermoanaerobaculia bacterium]|nr:hypothetical protein [Thermoanaerobaculia bacterium]
MELREAGRARHLPELDRLLGVGREPDAHPPQPLEHSQVIGAPAARQEEAAIEEAPALLGL